MDYIKMITAKTWKSNANFEEEWKFLHSGKIFGLVIKYKLQMETGLKNLEHAINCIPM